MSESGVGPEAALAIGMIYEREGMHDEAEGAFLTAALGGNAYGMYNVGQLATRAGDLERAAHWYQRAHTAGHPEAANNLGGLFFGIGDVAESYYWFQVAHGMGHPDAGRNLRILLSGIARAATARSLAQWAEQLRIWALRHYKRYTDAADPLSLDLTVETARDAAAAARETTLRDQYLTELRGLLWERFELTGQSADLDEAIDVSRELPAGAVNHSALGTALLARFTRLGRIADIDEAIGLLNSAVEKTPADAPARADRLATLAQAHQIRAEWTGSEDDEHVATNIAAQAIQASANADPDVQRLVPLKLGLTVDPARLSPEDPHRYVALTNLGRKLRSEGALAAAIRTLREAAAAAPVGHPDRAKAIAQLGAALLTADESRADEAIELLRAAMNETPDNHPAHADHAMMLASALVGRFPQDTEAIDILRAAAESPGSPPSDRVLAARMWAGLANGLGLETVALDGAMAAVDLLPLLTWHEWDRTTREGNLAAAAGMPREAAAFAIRCGRPELAVQLLEQGRSVLWSRRALEEFRPTGSQDRRPFSELAAAGRDGAVVIVNISTIRCDALIIGPDARSRSGTDVGSGSTVHVVPLPITWQQADAVSNRYLADLTAAAPDEAPFLVREQARHTMHDTLEWLWDAIVEPVLTALGHPREPVPHRPLPRLWWCPTASLTVLPLHAAGHYPRTANAAQGPSLLSLAVSSYTPTLAALLQTRRGAPTLATMLAVGLPHLPGGRAPLATSGAELDMIAARFSGPDDHRLLGEQATRDAVLHGLATHSWAHLSCHGLANLADPSRSAFALWDGPLTVLNVAEHRNPHADLAFLSACDTAAGGVRLPDEAIHLAAALQLAGYRHVIGTLWAIKDRPAPQVAETVYGILTANGGPDADRAAHAVHTAVNQLRTAHPTDPVIWAPYIHLGP